MMLIGAVVLTLLVQSQPPTRIVDPTNPNPMPSDARMMQFEWPEGATWRVFGVDSFPDGPVKIVGVAEIRQQNPPSTWSVHITNRGFMPVHSVIMAAAVVDINGAVKGTQPLVPIKNLKPQQVIRKEIPVRVKVIAPTDRVVFFVKEVKSETGDWKALDTDIAALIKNAALQMPVP